MLFCCCTFKRPLKIFSFNRKFRSDSFYLIRKDLFSTLLSNSHPASSSVWLGKQTVATGGQEFVFHRLQILFSYDVERKWKVIHFDLYRFCQRVSGSLDGEEECVGFEVQWRD